MIPYAEQRIADLEAQLAAANERYKKREHQWEAIDLIIADRLAVTERALEAERQLATEREKVAKLERRVNELNGECWRYLDEVAKLEAENKELRHVAEIEFQRAEGKAEMKRYFQEQLAARDSLIERAKELITIVHESFQASQDQNCHDRNSPEYCLFVQWLADVEALKE